ncbi:MAG: hypothetical protein Q9220_006506 [cf. Caloplaca sp. 1 TL-2023]
MPLNQEIQVMSSRPSDFDELDVQQNETAEPVTQPGDRCSTPTRQSGTAVMETPMVDRHQSPVEEQKSLTSSIAEEAIKGKEDSQLWSADPLKREAMITLREYVRTDNRSQADPSLGLRPSTPGDQADLDLPALGAASTLTKARDKVNDKANANVLNGKIPGEYQLDDLSADPSKPSGDIDVRTQAVNDKASARTTVREGITIDMEEDTSSQATEASSQSPSPVEVPKSASLPKLIPREEIRSTNGSKPGQGKLRKRSAPVDHDGEHPGDDTGSLLTPDVQQASSYQGRRKRPRRNSGRQAILEGKDESQNSIRSTIHVEVPHKVQSPAAIKSKSMGIKDSSTPRDSRKHAESPSSNKSSRSMSQMQEGDNGGTKAAIRIFYASSTKVDESTVYTRFLKKQNVKPVKKVNDCDVLCVGKGELKRTSNLILAVLMGKTIVTDQWISQSLKEDHLLDTATFIPEDASRAQDWGTSLADAIERGRHEAKPLRDWTINFTPSAKQELGKSWSELKEICLAGGAAAVQAMIPRKSPAESEDVIVIAASHDPDCTTLEERGWRIYTKDIITFSVLRGRIDAISDEFLIKSTKKAIGSAKKKKNRG